MLEADFCIEAVEEASAKHDKPEIFNTDQGNQITPTDFIKVLASRAIKISMDGKGAGRDNVFVERLWRTIKYEEAYLHFTQAIRKPAPPSGAILAFTTADYLTHRLTAKRQIRLNSISNFQMQ